jgi:long-chain acyl-CoA synthetase
MIDGPAARQPDSLALCAGDEQLTYGQLREERDRRAAVLIEAGIRAGDRVVVAEQSGPDLLIAFLACCQVGATFATFSPLFAPPELAALTMRVQPALALTADGQPREFLPASQTLPVTLPGEPSPVARQEVVVRALALPATAPAAIRGTSGTTGARPQLVVRTHEQLLWNRRLSAPWESAGSVVCCYVPNQFMSADLCFYLGLGTTVVFPTSGTPRSVEEALARHRATILYTPATLLQLLVTRRAAPPAVSRLAVVRAFASALDPRVRALAERRYGAQVFSEYGLTEHCGQVISARAPGTPVGSIGKPLPGIEVRVLDAAGRPVPDGTSGELALRSPGLIDGYLDDPEATAATLRDGWLWTGDIAYQDADGFFYIVGRRKLIINVAGNNVAPEEVEAVLQRHPGVREAVVLPLPDEKRGEALRAVIVPATSAPTADELRRFCRAHLANYKIPRQFEFRDTLPRSALGKVARQRL